MIHLAWLPLSYPVYKGNIRSKGIILMPEPFQTYANRHAAASLSKATSSSTPFQITKIYFTKSLLFQLKILKDHLHQFFHATNPESLRPEIRSRSRSYSELVTGSALFVAIATFPGPSPNPRLPALLAQRELLLDTPPSQLGALFSKRAGALVQRQAQAPLT